MKDYLLKSGICHLATTDMVATQRALESYRELDPTFARYVYRPIFNSPDSVLSRDFLSFFPVSDIVLRVCYSSLKSVLIANHHSTREHRLLVDLAESVENGK